MYDLQPAIHTSASFMGAILKEYLVLFKTTHILVRTIEDFLSSNLDVYGSKEKLNSVIFLDFLVGFVNFVSYQVI